VNRFWLLMALLVGSMFTAPNGARAQDGTPVAAGDIEIVYVLHVLNDITGVTAKGAQDAADAYGVSLQVVGPSAPNSNEQIPLFEAAVQKGVDGIVVIPQPGDVWVTPIQAAVEAGIPVVTTGVTSPDSAAGLWIGQDEFSSGVVLGEEMKTVLESKGITEGLIVVGSCFPGIPVLNDRYEGIRQALEGTNYELSEAYDVTGENNSNYAAWENLAAANPDMIAAVGLCSVDIPNLAPIKERSGAEWLIFGYDLNVPSLDAIRSGLAEVTVGQQPYVQGYLGVQALAEHLLNGTPLAEGWLQIPTEVVNASNVDTVYEREADEAAETEYYKPYLAEQFPNLTEEAAKLPYPGREAE
jgi:simple sugar transport system substrate-binding protein